MISLREEIQQLADCFCSSATHQLWGYQSTISVYLPCHYDAEPLGLYSYAVSVYMPQMPISTAVNVSSQHQYATKSIPTAVGVSLQHQYATKSIPTAVGVSLQHQYATQPISTAVNVSVQHRYATKPICATVKSLVYPLHFHE